jgi:hypothetical protein
MRETMSVAFRRESDDEHKEPEFELPIPVGANLVTPRGARLLTFRNAADRQGRVCARGLFQSGFD